MFASPSSVIIVSKLLKSLVNDQSETSLRRDMRAYYAKKKRALAKSSMKDDKPIILNKKDYSKELDMIQYSKDGLCGVVQGIHQEISEVRI